MKSSSNWPRLHTLAVADIKTSRVDARYGEYLDALPEMINPIRARSIRVQKTKSGRARRGRRSSASRTCKTFPVRTEQEGRRVRQAFIRQVSRSWQALCVRRLFANRDAHARAFRGDRSCGLPRSPRGGDIQSRSQGRVFREVTARSRLASKMRRVAKARCNCGRAVRAKPVRDGWTHWDQQVTPATFIRQFFTPHAESFEFTSSRS